MANGDFHSVPNNYLPVPAVPPVMGPGLDRVPHDRLVADRWSGSWGLSLVAVDPLHVGSGALVPIRRSGRDELARDLLTSKNKLLLPGSSLKGTIRTLVGVLTGGDAPPQDIARAMPMASSLFGTASGRDASFRGRVGFDDALSQGEVRIRVLDLRRAFEPRRHRAVGPRIYGPAPVGAPAEVPHVVAPVGTVFLGRMTVVNLDEGELGLLALAMGLDGSFCPRFGGGKYHGLGRMKVAVTAVELRQGRRRRERLEGEALSERIASWISQARASKEAESVLAVLRTQMGAP